MHSRLPNALDGIARHARAEAYALERDGILPPSPEAQRSARAERIARIAQATGPGVSPSQAFHRSPEYRRQLGELIEIAGRGRAVL